MARKLVSLSIVMLAGALSLHAQERGLGALTVTVCDETGAVIPKAAITVRRAGALQTVETTTNEIGNASIELAPGSYELSVRSRGFAKATRTVAVSEVENPRVAITLLVEIDDYPFSVVSRVPPLLSDAPAFPLVLLAEAPTLSAWIPEESVTQLTSLPARKFRRNH